MKNSDTAAVHPLSLWDKIKTGAKSFFKAALHYLPRGLLIGGAILGASALLVNVFPAADSLFHISSLHTAGDVAHRIGMTMMIGGLISGGVGAYHGITDSIKKNNLALAAREGELERCKSLGPEKQRSMDFMEPVAPTNIPNRAVDMLAHTVPHLIH